MTIEVSGVAASSAQLTTLRADLSVARDFGTVADQAAMVALATATPGSTCYRTDTTSLWVLKVVPYSSAGNWHNTAAAAGVQIALTPPSTTLAPCVDAVTAALYGGTVQTRTVNANTTLLRSDFGKVLDCVAASVITVPDDTTGGFSLTAGNNVFAIRRRTSGAVTWAAGGGVTINNPQALALVQNGPEVMLTEVAANTWNVS